MEVNIKEYLKQQLREFFVRMPKKLDNLSNVEISEVTNNQVIKYDSSQSAWTNTDIGTFVSLDNLSDVEISAVTNNQVIKYNLSQSAWTNTDIDTLVSLAKNTTYNSLVSDLNNNALVPNMLYRITDYVTTTAQADTQSAGHQFDLIVLAISVNTLDCQARAVPHTGVTYFSASGNTCDLSKWQIWYDIHNDTTKYTWADSGNGKGVIYRLIDEWENDCPYDFKNILFTVSGQTANAYTFNLYRNSTCSDHSLNGGYCYGNIIKPYYNTDILTLNFNVFYNTSNTTKCYSNTFGNDCYSNTFGYGCQSNTFGNDCYSNTFVGDCKSNTFGNNCYSNAFGSNCYSNTLGHGCYSNTFGYACLRNTFGNSCASNTIGMSCRSNTFGDYCKSNIFGNTCGYNTFGNSCASNTIGMSCRSNTFGNSCNHIIFGDSDNLGGTFCCDNIVENGNQYIRLYQTTGTAGSNNQLQNVYIAQGVNNTTTYVDISTIERNLSYRTTVARLSNGTIRIYKEDEDDINVQADWNDTDSGSSSYILNKPFIPNELSDLSNVELSSVTNNQIIKYNATQSAWTNTDIDTLVSLAKDTTYLSLFTDLENNALVPNMLYRITDYVTTTTYTATQSAGHQFDLIVVATSVNTLDCQARAVLHAGDTYFSATGNTCDLSKWQIWYDVNNDTTRYTWADSANGKGVIYRMVDDYGNDCPYDFKNIMFQRPLTNGTYDPTSGTNTWVYTFSKYSSGNIIDSTLVGSYKVYGNVQKEYKTNNRFTLNNNVFIGESCYHNTLENDCRNNTLGNWCYGNIFGYGCYSNTFGENCQDNEFGLECFSNIFGINCDGNIFGNKCQNNTFGDGCYSNTFENYCSNNTFGNNCNDNTFGNSCSNNTIGNTCRSNTFGNNCYMNIFGNNSNQYGTYIRYIIVDNGNKNIRLYNSGTPSTTNYLQNIYIAQGTNNTSTWLDISTIERNLSYRTTVAKLSNGNIRIYKEDEDDINVQVDWNESDSGSSSYILNKPFIPSELSDLSNVSISAATEGEVLVYDSNNDNWINKEISGGTRVVIKNWTNS